MLRDYIEWWGQQLFDLVPERIRLAAEPETDLLLIVPHGDSGRASWFDLQVLRGGRGTTLGRFALDTAGLADARRAADPLKGAPVRVRLPAIAALDKVLSLPLAAEREIERVLGYEMDRETPFAASEVWWTYEILARDKGRERLEVRLSLVPRDLIAELLIDLKQGFLEPGALEIEQPDGKSRVIPLTNGARLPVVRTPRSVRLTAIACAALALLCVGLPFIRQSLAWAEADREIAALKNDVEEAKGLRQRLEGAGGAEAIAAEHVRVGDPLAVLATATQLMPDDTYLTDFTMQQRRVTLNGQSVSAAKLIGLLAANPTFKDPAFAAPITRIEGARTEGFAIATEARP